MRKPSPSPTPQSDPFFHALQLTYRTLHRALWPILRQLPPKARHGLAFLCAGGMGFCTDSAILLTLEYGLGFSPFLARVFSIAGAMLVSWLAHRTLSFGVKVAPTLAEFLQFAVLGASAAVLNYATFSFLLWAGWVEKSFLALIASSLVAMVFSYCGMRFGVFRKTHSVGK